MKENELYQLRHIRFENLVIVFHTTLDMFQTLYQQVLPLMYVHSLSPQTAMRSDVTTKSTTRC